MVMWIWISEITPDHNAFYRTRQRIGTKRLSQLFVMSFKSDLEEAKELWKNSSLITKFILGLSVFLTTGSVASLSDVVFKWKGFILDAIVAYRCFITEPISSIAKLIGLSYSNIQVDTLILLSILFVSSARALGLRQFIEDFKRSPITESLFYLCILSLPISYGLSEINVLVIINFALVLVFIFIMSIAATKDGGIVAIKFLSPIIISISFTLILGAINSGLSRN